MLRYKECLFIKVSLKFLFKNSSVSYHPKVARQTVPFCRVVAKRFLEHAELNYRQESQRTDIITVQKQLL